MQKDTPHTHNASALAENGAFTITIPSLKLGTDDILATACITKDRQIAIPVNGQLWLYTFCPPHPMAERVVAILCGATPSTAYIHRVTCTGEYIPLGTAHRYATTNL